MTCWVIAVRSSSIFISYLCLRLELFDECSCMSDKSRLRTSKSTFDFRFPPGRVENEPQAKVFCRFCRTTGETSRNHVLNTENQLVPARKSAIDRIVNNLAHFCAYLSAAIPSRITPSTPQKNKFFFKYFFIEFFCRKNTKCMPSLFQNFEEGASAPPPIPARSSFHTQQWQSKH